MNSILRIDLTFSGIYLIAPDPPPLSRASKRWPSRTSLNSRRVNSVSCSSRSQGRESSSWQKIEEMWAIFQSASGMKPPTFPSRTLWVSRRAVVGLRAAGTRTLITFKLSNLYWQDEWMRALLAAVGPEGQTQSWFFTGSHSRDILEWVFSYLELVPPFFFRQCVTSLISLRVCVSFWVVAFAHSSSYASMLFVFVFSRTSFHEVQQQLWLSFPQMPGH